MPSIPRPARQRPTIEPNAGRRRAQRWFPLPALCEECGEAPAVERHHRDGDTFNNTPANVAALCRTCHMRLDGRLEAFRLQAMTRDKTQPPKPCSECGRLYKPLRRGLCARCYDRTHPRPSRAR